MNEQQVLSYLLKQIGITPNSLPSNKKQAWSTGKYNASGELVPKDEARRYEVLYDKEGNNPEPSPVNNGLLSLMPTGVGDLAVETVASGIGEAKGSGVAGVLAGGVAALGSKAFKNIFNPKTKKIESYYIYTPPKTKIYNPKESIVLPKRFANNPKGDVVEQFIESRKNQKIYNPETKQIENITTEEFQEILKNTEGIDAPFLEQRIRPDVLEQPIDNVKGFGNLGWKGAGEPLQYADMNVPMTDIDFPDKAHKGGKMQITAQNLGEAMEIIKKYVGDNKIERLMNVGLTPGGARGFDISFMGNLNNRGTKGLFNRIEFLEDTKSDPFYKQYEMGRTFKLYEDLLSRNGYKFQGREKFLQDLFKGDIPVEMKQKFLGLGPLKSAVRLDPKPARLYKMTGDKVSSPFTFQSLIDIGNPKLTSRSARGTVDIHNALVEKLRLARGASDPNRPDLGFGFLDDLEKQLKTVSPKDASKIKENLFLGGIPAVELLQEEE